MICVVPVAPGLEDGAHGSEVVVAADLDVPAPHLVDLPDEAPHVEVVPVADLDGALHDDLKRGEGTAD